MTDGFFAKFLPLLGFEDDSLLSSPDLFVLPNQDAFQKIVHFLLKQLDIAKSAELFRDCWPILDRKQEAEFRRNAFTLYKDLQLAHPDSLPKINASLFQNPGGRKFLNFVTCLVRHATIQKLQGANIVVPKNLIDSNHLDVFKELFKENVGETHKQFKHLDETSDEVDKLVAQLAGDYRRLKSKLPKVEEAIQDEIEGGGSDVLKARDSLHDKCQDLLESGQAKRKEFMQLFSDISKDLDTIEATSNGKQATLDVNDLPLDNLDGSAKLSSILEKLIAASLDIKFGSGQSVQFPLASLESASGQVARHRDKFLGQEHKLAHDEVPGTVKNVARLEDNLSLFDWKQTLGSSGTNQNRPQGPMPVVPPTPGIQIQDSPGPAGNLETGQFALARHSEPSQDISTTPVTRRLESTRLADKSSIQSLASFRAFSPYSLDQPDRLACISTPEFRQSESTRFVLSPGLVQEDKCGNQDLDKSLTSLLARQTESMLDKIIQEKSVSHLELTRPEDQSSYDRKNGQVCASPNLSKLDVGSQLVKFALSPSFIQQGSPLLGSSPNTPVCLKTLPDLALLSPSTTPSSSALSKQDKMSLQTPGGKRLKSRLNDLISTLDNYNSRDSDNDSFLTSQNSLPDLCTIDF